MQNGFLGYVKVARGLLGQPGGTVCMPSKRLRKLQDGLLMMQAPYSRNEWRLLD